MEILPFADFKRKLWKNLMHFIGVYIRVNFRSGVQSSVLKLLSLEKKSLFIVRGSLFEFRFSEKCCGYFVISLSAFRSPTLKLLRINAGQKLIFVAWLSKVSFSRE